MPDQALSNLARKNQRIDPATALGSLAARQFRQEKAGAKNEKAVLNSGMVPDFPLSSVPDPGARKKTSVSEPADVGPGTAEKDAENSSGFGQPLNLDRMPRNPESENNKNGQKEEDRPGEPLKLEDTKDEVSKARELGEKKKEAGMKEKAVKALEKKVMEPARMATGNALKWAWRVLIPSWGLSLIYINMHVFLRLIFPSAFCKLGEEWVPKIVTGEHTSKNVAGTAFGILEVSALLFLDLLLIMAILAILAILSAVVSWMDKSILEKAWSILQGIATLAWTGLEGLINLFKDYRTL